MSIPVSIEWIKQNPDMNASDNATNTTPSITCDVSGFTYVAYSTSGQVTDGTTSGSNDIVVLKIDPSGNVILRIQNTNLNTSASDVTPVIGIDISSNIYVCYQTGDVDIRLVKLGSSGDFQWVQAGMNTAATDTLPSIAVDSAGNSYIAFRTAGTTSGGIKLTGSDIAVCKVNTSGGIVWTQQQSSMNTTGTDSEPVIAIDSSGDLYVSYRSTGVVSGGSGTEPPDIIIFKLQGSDGSFQWARQSSDFNTYGADTSPTITTDLSGNVYVAFATTGTVSGGTTADQTDIAVMKFNSVGTLQWVKQETSFNRNGIDSEPSICADINNEIYVAYSTTDTSGSGGGINDILLFKLDSSGNYKWLYRNAALNSTVSDQTPSICVDGLGKIYCAFHTFGTITGGEQSGSTDIVVARLTQSDFIVPDEDGGGGGPICFLGNAPVLTPTGYRRIDSLCAGDLVQTADGRTVAIQRVKSVVALPGPNADPFVIPAGRFGAITTLPISPRHRVAVPGRGMVEARDIGGLARLPMRAAWSYYNIGLPNWATDNLVVGGVIVESLAPVERVQMTIGEFRALLVKKYGVDGARSKAVMDRVLATCRLGTDGRVEVPVIRR